MLVFGIILFSDRVGTYLQMSIDVVVAIKIVLYINIYLWCDDDDHYDIVCRVRHGS